MIFDVTENKDTKKTCDAHKCSKTAEVNLQLLGDTCMCLCKEHCRNTLVNLGVAIPKILE